MIELEFAWEVGDRCGEAPFWDAAGRRMLWMDITAGLLHSHSFDVESGYAQPLGVPASGLTIDRSGDLVLGGEAGLLLWRNQAEYYVIADEHLGEKLSINDLIADCAGRVYAGTIYWGENGMEKPGKLYLFDGRGVPRIVDDGILLANGLGFSTDDRTLYMADSAARLIYAYEVDSADGSLSNRRTFARIPPEDGIPDGLTVDSEGFVWCAMWYGAQVIRFDPDGTIEQRIQLPVSQVSSVAFGGEDLTTLYVTTAADPWPSTMEPPGFDWKARPPGGGLYAFRTDVQGKPEHLAGLNLPQPPPS